MRSALAVPLPSSTWTAARVLAASWLGLAIAVLTASALFALLLVVLKAPLPVDTAMASRAFQSVLVLHVNLSFVLWPVSMAGALWALWGRPRALTLGWVAWALVTASAIIVLATPFLGRGQPMMSNYVPVIDSPLFLAGMLLFAVGAALVCLRALVLAFPQGPGEDALPATVAWLVALPLAIALLSLGWSYALLPDAARGQYFDRLFWGPGHALLFAHATLTMAAWLSLAGGAGIAPLPGRRSVLALAALAALPVLAVPLLHIVYPVDSHEFRSALTSLMRYGAWPGPLVLGLLLVAAARRNGVNSWAQKAARRSLVLSVALFALGVMVGTAIRADNAMVPAHYHGTVGAMTLALMGLAMHLLPRIGVPMPDSPALARQPLLYGGGLLLVVAGLAGLGLLGGARKVPAVTTAPVEIAAVAVAVVGGVIAVGGVIVFLRLVLRAWWDASVQPGRSPRGSRAAGTADRRPVLLLVTVVLIAAGGAVLSLLPDSGPATPVTEPLGVQADPRREPAAHAHQARQAEIGARFEQGVAMLHAKQYEHAMTALHRVLELAPEMPEAHVNMGFALLGLKRHREALDFFRSATELRAEQANAYYGMAVAYEGLGDLESALGAMRTYVHRTSPDDPYLVKAQSALWEWEEALAKSRKPLLGNENH